jgi:hypothetical protein
MECHAFSRSTFSTFVPDYCKAIDQNEEMGSVQFSYLIPVEADRLQVSVPCQQASPSVAKLVTIGPRRARTRAPLGSVICVGFSTAALRLGWRRRSQRGQVRCPSPHPSHWLSWAAISVLSACAVVDPCLSVFARLVAVFRSVPRSLFSAFRTLARTACVRVVRVGVCAPIKPRAQHVQQVLGNVSCRNDVPVLRRPRRRRH